MHCPAWWHPASLYRTAVHSSTDCSTPAAVVHRAWIHAGTLHSIFAPFLRAKRKSRRVRKWLPPAHSRPAGSVQNSSTYRYALLIQVRYGATSNSQISRFSGRGTAVSSAELCCCTACKRRLDAHAAARQRGSGGRACDPFSAWFAYKATQKCEIFAHKALQTTEPLNLRLVLCMKFRIM